MDIKIEIEEEREKRMGNILKSFSTKDFRPVYPEWFRKYAKQFGMVENENFTVFERKYEEVE